MAKLSTACAATAVTYTGALYASACYVTGSMARLTFGYDREYFVEQIAGMAAIVDECKVDEDEAIAIFIKAINDRDKKTKRAK